MSLRTICIWIIVAGLLGSGVIFLRAQQTSASLTPARPTSRGIGFDPGAVETLSVHTESGLQVMSKDTEQLGQWRLQWAHDGLDHTWSAQSSKVRSGLRALATAQVFLLDEDSIEVSAGELSVEVQDGRRIRVEFDAQSAGGYRAVRVEELSADGTEASRWFGRIDNSVFETFIRKGILPWRSTLLFAMAPSAVRSISLEAGGLGLLLERSQSGWNITRPYQIAADTQAAEDLAKVLLALKADSFVDLPPEQSVLGLSSPIATIGIGTIDQHIQLRVGLRSDINADSLYALLEGPSGDALITLGQEQFAGLTAAAAPYISKVPRAVPSRLVQSVHVTGRDGTERFLATRDESGWMIGGHRAESISRDAVDRLVGLITLEQAKRVQVLRPSEPLDSIGQVELRDREGLSMALLSFSLENTDSGIGLMLSWPLESGETVVWNFDSEAAVATAAWLMAVAGKRVP